MSFKYKLPNRGKLVMSRLKSALRDLRKISMKTTERSLRGLVVGAYKAFLDVYTKIGLPRFSFTKLEEDDIRSLEIYNSTRERIEDDIRAASDEIPALGNAVVESFNLSHILSQEILRMVSTASGKAQDLAILRKTSRVRVLTAGDDFNDNSRIDTGYTLSSPIAYIQTDHGIATLSRVSTNSVLNKDVEITVSPVLPEGIQSLPTDGNLRRFYEGDFYAIVGQAVPEGGRWHLEETVQPGTDPVGFTFNETLTQKKNGKVFKDKSKPTIIGGGGGEALGPTDIAIRDRGATEDEKKAIRRRMLDSNPDTYWMCEYVLGVDSLNGEKAFESEDPAASEFSDIPETESSSKKKKKKKKKFSIFKNKKKKKRKKTVDSPGPPTEVSIIEDIPSVDDPLKVTPEDLRAAAAANDIADFAVDITLTFLSPVTMNWLSLLPMNFGETTWLKVLNIETATTRNSELKAIEGLDRNLFENILTEDANAELSPAEAEHILSPSRYGYRGTGIWTFSARQVQIIRFRLVQEVPVPDLYQRIIVQLHKIKSKSSTLTYTSSDRKLVTKKEKELQATRLIVLDYLQTLKVYLGQIEASTIAGATAGGSIVKGGGDSKTDTPNFIEALFGGTSSTRSSTWNQFISDSGWVLNATWLQTYYDRISYKIGIRDIGAFRHEYASSSEIVSVKYFSAKPIHKITLEIDVILPKGTDIEYYVSHNNGKKWLRINPIDHTSIFSKDGTPIPRILVFNQAGIAPDGQKYVDTDLDVTEIRFRAVLRTDNTTVTPVIKKYRLLLYPQDSATPADEIV